MRGAELQSMQNVVQAYVFYTMWRVTFEIIGCHGQGYGAQLQQACYAVGHCCPGATRCWRWSGGIES